MDYSLQQFERDIEKVQPRPFDTYVLPGFLIFYAIRSKGGMGRLARRMLFSAGVYMVYRNYARYKEAYTALAAAVGARAASGGGDT